MVLRHCALNKSSLSAGSVKDEGGVAFHIGALLVVGASDLGASTSFFMIKVPVYRVNYLILLWATLHMHLFHLV